MGDFTGDPSLSEEDRLAYYLNQASKVTTVEGLAKVLIEAGWGGAGTGDPPIEKWPAFHILVPLLRTALTRAALIV